MRLLLHFVYAAVIVLLSSQPGWAVTESDLRDAILEKTPAAAEMDVNGDGRVDVADLVRLLKGSSLTCNSLIGEHIGTFYREGGELIRGRNSTGGQISFALKITDDSPLTAEIDNLPDSVLGHYSLYFPAEKIPVTVHQPNENSLEFEFSFTTASSELSPDTPLNRHMKFSGSFTDENRRILSGTYQESVSGFMDNQGKEIPVNFNGSFTMVLECAE